MVTHVKCQQALQDYFPRDHCSVVPQAFLATIDEAFQWLRQARKDYIENCQAKLSTLFEQGATQERIRAYCRRFKGWLTASLEPDICITLLNADACSLLAI